MFLNTLPIPEPNGNFSMTILSALTTNETDLFHGYIISSETENEQGNNCKEEIIFEKSIQSIGWN